MAKKKRRRQSFDWDYYHFRIAGWHWEYSFGVNVGRQQDTAYPEYCYLTIEATVLRPQKIETGAAELIFIPESGLAELDREAASPRLSVGSLELRDAARLFGHLFMPTDALDPILQMLIAERFKYLLLNGERMRWRRALVHRYEFAADYNKSDYPAEP